MTAAGRCCEDIESCSPTRPGCGESREKPMSCVPWAPPRARRPRVPRGAQPGVINMGARFAGRVMKRAPARPDRPANLSGMGADARDEPGFPRDQEVPVREQPSSEQVAALDVDDSAAPGTAARAARHDAAAIGQLYTFIVPVPN